MQATINRVFPRMRRPILPGFDFFVRRTTYEEVDGLPNVPNEDTAFSRRLAATGPVACQTVPGFWSRPPRGGSRRPA